MKIVMNDHDLPTREELRLWGYQTMIEYIRELVRNDLNKRNREGLSNEK